MDFLTSIGVLLLCGLLLGSICKRIHLPSLVGMLVVGIVLSPYALNLLSPDLLTISADIRQLALIIILTRAGLSFDFAELKKNGRSATMLCFVPALFEIVGYLVFGTWLLDMSVKDAAIMGCVMAAVSPAVIVPRMLKLKEEGYGTNKGIPQMIMAGASADDIFVIILFTSLMALPTGQGFDLGILWKIPCFIILGIGVGLLLFYQGRRPAEALLWFLYVSVFAPIVCFVFTPVDELDDLMRDHHWFCVIVLLWVFLATGLFLWGMSDPNTFRIFLSVFGGGYY